MCDLSFLTVDALRDRLCASITDRLDALGTDERARAGDDVLDVLDELARRGCAPLTQLDDRPAVRAVLRPARGSSRPPELLLVTAGALLPGGPLHHA